MSDIFSLDILRKNWQSNAQEQHQDDAVLLTREITVEELCETFAELKHATAVDYPSENFQDELAECEDLLNQLAEAKDNQEQKQQVITAMKALLTNLEQQFVDSLDF